MKLSFAFNKLSIYRCAFLMLSSFSLIKANPLPEINGSSVIEHATNAFGQIEQFAENAAEIFSENIVTIDPSEKSFAFEKQNCSVDENVDTFSECIISIQIAGLTVQQFAIRKSPVLQFENALSKLDEMERAMSTRFQTAQQTGQSLSMPRFLGRTTFSPNSFLQSSSVILDSIQSVYAVSNVESLQANIGQCHDRLAEVLPVTERLFENDNIRNLEELDSAINVETILHSQPVSINHQLTFSVRDGNANVTTNNCEIENAGFEENNEFCEITIRGNPPATNISQTYRVNRGAGLNTSNRINPRMVEVNNWLININQRMLEAQSTSHHFVISRRPNTIGAFASINALPKPDFQPTPEFVELQNTLAKCRKKIKAYSTYNLRDGRNRSASPPSNVDGYRGGSRRNSDASID